MTVGHEYFCPGYDVVLWWCCQWFKCDRSPSFEVSLECASKEGGAPVFVGLPSLHTVKPLEIDRP